MAKKREKTMEYNYFFSALKHYAEIKGRGLQASLFASTGIAEGTISTIINEKRMATFEQQIKIAKALEFDYIEFLSFGKSIFSGQKPIEKPPPQKESEGNSSETLIKAAEAFCTVLVEESEKVKKKRVAG